MEIKRIERHQTLASRTTLVCLLSLLIGGGLTMAILGGGGAEALGAIIPMSVVGIVHLVGGPVAIFHAYRARRHNRNIRVYLYFLFYLVFSFLLVGPEAILYYVFFILFTAVPVLYFSVQSFVHKTN